MAPLVLVEPAANMQAPSTDIETKHGLIASLFHEGFVCGIASPTDIALSDKVLERCLFSEKFGEYARTRIEGMTSKSLTGESTLGSGWRCQARLALVLAGIGAGGLGADGRGWRLRWRALAAVAGAGRGWRWRSRLAPVLALARLAPVTFPTTRANVPPPLAFCGSVPWTSNFAKGGWDAGEGKVEGKGEGPLTSTGARCRLGKVNFADNQKGRKLAAIAKKDREPGRGQTEGKRGRTILKGGTSKEKGLIHPIDG